KSFVESVTKLRPKLEAEGFLRHPNAALLRALLAVLNARSARTSFKLVKGRKGDTAMESALRLAAEAARRVAPDAVNVGVDPVWKISGASLAAMSQGFAYRAIKSAHAAKLKPRAQTNINLMNIIDDIESVFGVKVSTADVWRSIRSKHITKVCSQFLWKAIHDIFMIGKHWIREGMPEEYQSRAICETCGNLESMDHILFRCEATGQAEVWGELKKAW
ncbi:hypothetical protein BD310DRAFT_791141, partial [Dichomitus squalens]